MDQLQLSHTIIDKLDNLVNGPLFDLTYERDRINICGFMIFRELDLNDYDLDTDIYSIRDSHYTELIFSHHIVYGIRILKNTLTVPRLLMFISILDGKYEYEYKKKDEICAIYHQRFISITHKPYIGQPDNPAVLMIEYGELMRILLNGDIVHNCIICMDAVDIDDVIIHVPCLHICHLSCIKSWWKVSNDMFNKCSICKM